MCTAAPRTVPFRFQYTDKPQAVQTQSCFREPCALFVSADQCYKWMGWYPFSAGKQWIVEAQSGETHHTSLSSDGKWLCPRSSIRRHIASVWVYLMHKYPSLRRQLEGYLSWEVALNWLKLPVTLRELFMDLYSQRLMGDLNPWCYAPDRIELVRKPDSLSGERATNQLLGRTMGQGSAGTPDFRCTGRTQVASLDCLAAVFRPGPFLGNQLLGVAQEFAPQSLLGFSGSPWTPLVGRPESILSNDRRGQTGQGFGRVGGGTMMH